LAAEKQAIAYATSRSRAIALVSQLLYHCELECKALLTPEHELTQKITEFEDAALRFEAERRNLSDFLSIDSRRLLTVLTETTDQLWAEGRAKFANVAKAETLTGFDDRQVRIRLGEAVESYFDEAARKTTELVRAELVSRLTKHEAKASVLLAQVRQAAADLMEISVSLPPAELAFELTKEPYWVTPSPATSILDASAVAFMRWIPRLSRGRHLRRKIASETEKAVLRNVANLEWALRQNVDDAFRRFEASLSKQLSAAIDDTRQVMRMVLDKRLARSAEAASLVAQTKRSIAALNAALQGLERAETG
jgi:hypothetical protein